MEQEKTFANWVSEKRLVSKIHKEQLLNSKQNTKTNSSIKIGLKDILQGKHTNDQQIHEKKSSMANGSSH